MTDPDLLFNVSRLDDTRGMVPEPLVLPALPSGATARVLRRHDNGSLRSALVDLPAGYDSGCLAGAVGLQGYVLDGSLQAADATVSAGTFFFDPLGRRFR